MMSQDDMDWRDMLDTAVERALWRNTEIEEIEDEFEDAIERLGRIDQFRSGRKQDE